MNAGAVARANGDQLAQTGQKPLMPGRLLILSHLFHDLGVMQFNPQTSLTRFIGRREGRRVPGRLPQESFQCGLGPVLDLSSGGMRVLCTRPYQGELQVHLEGYDVVLSIRTRVAWVQKLGFRRFEIGFAFLDIDEDVALMLTRISTIHRERRAI
ncbi:MAG: PilZ domain-containing protein [Planctomycetota bacterium]|nr:PilZ domain-containing protein [Planctomycetota bacterium]